MRRFCENSRQGITLGSLFDGIGGWLLAARHAGVTPVWASEVETFPSAVTATQRAAVIRQGTRRSVTAWRSRARTM